MTSAAAEGNKSGALIQPPFVFSFLALLELFVVLLSAKWDACVIHESSSGLFNFKFYLNFFIRPRCIKRSTSSK